MRMRKEREERPRKEKEERQGKEKEDERAKVNGNGSKMEMEEESYQKESLSPALISTLESFLHRKVVLNFCTERLL